MQRSFKDNDEIEEARRILKQAAKYARNRNGVLDIPLFHVFERWAHIAGFGDALNRVGGPETVHLAKYYLQHVCGVFPGEDKE